MKTSYGFINAICPNCLDQNFDNDWNGLSKCGYQFPLNLIIDYNSSWDYNKELIEKCCKVDGLYLAGKFIGKHPEFLSKFQQVKQLYLSRYSGFKFELLRNFHSLKILELDYLNIVNLGNIEKLDALSSLKLTECRKLMSISDVTKLKLKTLRITLCNNIIDIEKIGCISSLKLFTIEGKVVENIGFIENLTNLEVLNLNIKIADKNLQYLFKLKKLKKIGLKKGRIKKIDIDLLKRTLPDCRIKTY